MTTRSTTPQSSAPSATASGGSTGQAGDTAHKAKDSAAHEADRVGREARDQARNLWGQTREELTAQAATQQDRVASGLRDLSDQLRSMASSGEESPARDLVEDVARRTGTAASWLEDREPGSVADEVRDFARRRPGAFLAVAAGLGVVAGRLSRGMADESGATPGSGGVHRTQGSHASTGAGTAAAATPDVDSGPGLTTPVAPAQPGVGATRSAHAEPATTHSPATGTPRGTAPAGTASAGMVPGATDDDIVVRGER